jgi:hypothetical protein
MTLPPGFSFTRAWDEAFSRELSARGVLLDDADRHTAAQAVAEAEAAAWGEVRDFATTTLVQEAKQRQQATEREQSRRKELKRQRNQIAGEARSAWRKLYGPEIAGQLRPFVGYTVLETGGGDDGVFVFAAPYQLNRSSVRGSAAAT